jgi:transcriptional enhancer factor
MRVEEKGGYGEVGNLKNDYVVLGDRKNEYTEVGESNGGASGIGNGIVDAGSDEKAQMLDWDAVDDGFDYASLAERAEGLTSPFGKCSFALG